MIARILFIGCLLLTSLGVSGQDLGQTEAVKDSVPVDEKYREDQFYFGLTYNLLTDTPANVKIRGFSGGARFGFVRDMPINAQRTLAIGLGAGLGFNRYGNTLSIAEDANDQLVLQVLDEETNFESNRFSVYHVEVPLELRWRSSTPTEFKFYRVHTGVIFSYAYWNRATFVQDGTRFTFDNLAQFNPFQAEAFLLLGYNTINFYAAYNFTAFFDSEAKLAEEPVNFRPLKLGILFYFL
ncbi:outer membrane beta-barrel protein [Gilvibacter sp.]|uniref:outer membrane beta-barrel protein n=1 Tax=Gilvibacter sp. TaxID=2729997 RepID=UPI0035BE8EA1